VLNRSRRLAGCGPARFVARRLNTSSIRSPRASRPGFLAQLQYLALGHGLAHLAQGLLLQLAHTLSRQPVLVANLF